LDIKMNKKEILLKALEDMIKIRIIEENIAKEFKKNKVLSFLHLSIGQEACATGVAFGTKVQDNFFGNHRSHGHYLAKGGNISRMIYEVFGDNRGCCSGHGGSMHMLDKNVNFLGSVPILGSSLPIASGIAMSEKLKKKDNLTVVFIGDGSAEEGSFYETLNMAGLYKLPLLIVIEDNKYAVESDKIKRKVNGYDFKSIIEKGLKANYKRVDGQDFLKVFDASKKLRKKILKDKSIGVLHLDCLRFSKHSGAEISTKDQKSKYRKNEYFEIIKKDPIKILKQNIIRAGMDLIQIEKIINKLQKKYNKIFYTTFNKINIKKV
tara:strand:- start:1328 stop:2290 length:963 start_codon:yes stop_codon:yes gene_type:complete